MASPSFRSANENSGTGTSISVNAPAGIVDDDILIFLLDRSEANDAVILTGFTQLFLTAYGNVTGGQGSLWCGWKRASSESGAYAPTWASSSANVTACMHAISDVDTGDTPAVGTTVTPAASNAPDPPNVDPGSSGDRIGIVVIGQEGKGDNRFSASASGYTVPAASNIGTFGGGAGRIHCGCCIAYRQYTGQAENPGALASSATELYAANTISLLGTAAPEVLFKSPIILQAVKDASFH